MPAEQTENPYQSPTSELAKPRFGTLPDGTQVRGKLFSPGHVAWATFLGVGVGGCALLAINYQRLCKNSEAKIAWCAAVIVYTFLSCMPLMAPTRFPVQWFNLVLVFMMYHFAKTLQGRTFERVLASGGEKASAWEATVIALFCVALYLPVVVAAYLFWIRPLE